MYTEFYNLNFKPFQISSDPAFLWLGEKHQEAFATLKYGILDNKGFLLLTGDVGTGKTTLINALLKSLGEDVICTTVPDPNLNKIDLFNYIAAGFNLNTNFVSKGAFLVQFSHFLRTAYDDGKKVLLIIDEAQLLTQELLEEIRLLSNIERAETKLLNIFFVGQNEFNDILSHPQNRPVRQRLTLNYNLEPLTPYETMDYIKYRLKIAGTAEQLFNSGAVQVINQYSGGFPRRINILCDHALLTGYVRNERKIGPAIVHECARELNIVAKGVGNVPVPDLNLQKKEKTEHKVSNTAPVPPSSLKKISPVEDNYQHRHSSLPAVVMLVLLVLIAGYLLYPDSIRQCFIRADEYGRKMKVVIAQMLTRDSLSSVSITKKIDLSKNAVITNEGSSGKRELPVELHGELTGELKPDEIKKKSQTFNDLPDTEKAKHGEAESHDHENPETINSDTPDGYGLTPDVDQFKEAATETSLPPPLETLSSFEPILPIPLDKVIVRFSYNNNDFTEQGFRALKDFAEILVDHPEVDVMVTGYTDTNGSQAYNKKLSEFRANIVKSYLLGRGVMSDQVSTRGLGGENPMESNDSAWGRMMNRRVEIEVENPSDVQPERETSEKSLETTAQE